MRADRAVDAAMACGRAVDHGAVYRSACIASPAAVGMMAAMSTWGAAPRPRSRRTYGRCAERGDRAAFARIFAFYGPRVKAYLRRLGAEDAVAEDLTQEVMLVDLAAGASVRPHPCRAQHLGLHDRPQQADRRPAPRAPAGLRPRGPGAGRRRRAGPARRPLRRGRAGPARGDAGGRAAAGRAGPAAADLLLRGEAAQRHRRGARPAARHGEVTAAVGLGKLRVLLNGFDG